MARNRKINNNPIIQEENVSDETVQVYQEPEKLTEVLATPEKTIVQTAAYQSMVQYFWDALPVDATDAFEEIVDSILATDADKVLDMTEGIDSAGKWAHQPIRVLDLVGVRESAFGGVWLAVQLTPLTGADAGDVHTVAFGSPTLLAQLAVLHRAGRLPIECKIVPIKSVREGKNPPLYLRKLEYRG